MEGAPTFHGGGWMEGLPPQTAPGGRLQDFSCPPHIAGRGHLPGTQCRPSPPQGWLQPPAAPTRPTKRVRPCTSTPNPQNTGAQTPGHTLQCPHFQSKTTMQAPHPPRHPMQAPWGVSQVGTSIVFVSHPIWVLALHPDITRPAK